jgi:hypothetical protein
MTVRAAEPKAALDSWNVTVAPADPMGAGGVTNRMRERLPERRVPLASAERIVASRRAAPAPTQTATSAGVSNGKLSRVTWRTSGVRMRKWSKGCSGRKLWEVEDAQEGCQCVDL